MYVIINKTTGITAYYEGNFPQIAENLVLEGNDIIIISTYSNTIKTPVIVEEYSKKLVNWKDYLIPISITVETQNNFFS